MCIRDSEGAEHLARALEAGCGIATLCLRFALPRIIQFLSGLYVDCICISKLANLVNNCKSYMILQQFEGSFSAVSKPIFASKHSFCSIFQDLQDLCTSARIQTQQISKKRLKLISVREKLFFEQTDLVACERFTLERFHQYRRELRLTVYTFTE